jgi:hypothetical protein
MLRFIELFRRARGPLDVSAGPNTAARPINARALHTVFDLRSMGTAERQIWQRIWSAVGRRLELAPFVMQDLFQYAQIRHMFRQQGYWEPRLAASLA